MKVGGEIVYFYVYDIGEEIELSKVEKIMKKLPQFVELKYSRLTPAYISIKPAPIFVDLGKRKIEIDGKESEIQVQAKLYAVGVISVALRLPFEEDLEKLLSYGTATVKYHGKEVEFEKIGEDIAKKIVDDLKENIAQKRLEAIPQFYKVYCISSLEQKQDAKTFVKENRKILTAILREEKSVKTVSTDEIEDALKYQISYYDEDVIIIDWFVGIIIDPSKDYEDQLLTIELANIQLSELIFYDNLIDGEISKAYDDIRRLTTSGMKIIFSNPEKILISMAETRMEIEEIVETTINIAKFFGDWYLGRIYSCLSDKLHLKEWENSVLEKLKTLEGLYTIASDQVQNSRSITLELLMIFLVVIEFAFWIWLGLTMW